MGAERSARARRPGVGHTLTLVGGGEAAAHERERPDPRLDRRGGEGGCRAAGADGYFRYMRIAEIAPVWFTVPPTGYGGIEIVVSLLADGLVDRGHDVTLFASGGSRTRADLVSPLPDPPDPVLLGDPWFDAFHTLSSFLDARDFDVIHDHSGIIGPALGAMLGKNGPPVVHTLHGPWTEPAKRYYRLLDRRVDLVAISDSQRANFDEIHYAGTVHNGIGVDSYHPILDWAHKEDFLIYLGRANPDKGPAQAIEIAKRVGKRMIMCVKKSEPFEQDYWAAEVEPHLTSDIDVRENVPHDEKADLLARAEAMVFPIQWPEPFGLVMVEAMASGTPVITAPLGAAPELVADGVTGYLRSTIDEMADCVGQVRQLDPIACRKRVEEHFSAAAMVQGYLDVFASAVEAH